MIVAATTDLICRSNLVVLVPLMVPWMIVLVVQKTRLFRRP